MEYKEILKPLFNTIREVFHAQCNIKLQHKNSYRIPPGGPWCSSKDEMVISTVKLESDKVNCSIGFAFKEQIFLKFVSNMFGEQINETNDEIRDLAAEWLNITLGYLKGILNDEMKENFTNTIPMNFFGNNLSIQTSSISPLFVIPFESEHGQFDVLLMLGNQGMVPWDNSFIEDIAMFNATDAETA